MAQERVFSAARTIYWPTEFSYIVNILKGLDVNGEPSHEALYRYNTGPIILAAVLGLAHNRERAVGPQRQEISTDTFEGHRIGNSSLASMILLIGLMGAQDIELLRPEREEELVRKFERYAAGGFEYLRGALAHSDDVTGHKIVLQEIERARVMQVGSELKI